MEMTLLNAFSMIALRVRQPKESLFKERVLLVPEAECNIDEAVSVRNTCDTILSPTKRSRPSVFVREVWVRMTCQLDPLP